MEFNIDYLIGLFSNQKVKDIILKSYKLSQIENKELSDLVFNQLMLLKLYEKLDIVLTDKDADRDCFVPSKNVIALNEDCSEFVFFHELTHALSYSYHRFFIPKEFARFKRDATENKLNFSFLINDIEMKKYETIFTAVKDDDDFKKKLKEIDSLVKLDNKTATEGCLKILVMAGIEDIIDALFDGEAFDRGLHHSANMDSIIVKSLHSSSGHGCKYFRDSKYNFEEILANYQAIKLVDPDNMFFAQLKFLLGEEFVSFLDEYCLRIDYFDLKDRFSVLEDRIVLNDNFSIEELEKIKSDETKKK